uniref:Uncharacterized protein n=1 Tax=viral metagenome TaxID=1070528 RepID=A0A6C0IEI0_9ZZZZ
MEEVMDIQHRVTPDPQTRKRKIICKQELIIQSLQIFYSNRSDLVELLKIIEGESLMSLRLIDWFVTNYAKFHNISYIHKGSDFFVYIDYKNQLKAYSKKLFDPFCRRERILFQIGSIPAFVTTVGKLNFFRWAIEKGVLDYIQLNLSNIEKEMNQSAKELQKIRKQETKELKESKAKRITRRKVLIGENVSSKQMQKYNSPIEITFD